MIPVYNKIICQRRAVARAAGTLLRASTVDGKLVEAFIAEQGDVS